MTTTLVCFKSTASASSGLYWLSNFAPTQLKLTWPSDFEHPHLKGRTCTYETSEHAYQATKAADLHTALQFEVGGMVSMLAFKRWPVRRGIVKVSRTTTTTHTTHICQSADEMRTPNCFYRTCTMPR